VPTPGAPPKDVKNEDRSGNVYENKGKGDSLSAMKNDFSAQFNRQNRFMTIWTTNRERSEDQMSKMKVHPAISMKTKAEVSGTRYQVSGVRTSLQAASLQDMGEEFSLLTTVS
jgi:hypothetical protein